MIIGFLGKGGSGKSTLSSNFVNYLRSKDKEVLAIDADHNMDFTYNLEGPEEMNYIGQGLQDIYSHVGASSASEVFTTDIPETFFSLSPLDPVTEKYTTVLPSGVRLMTAGPHTDTILYGQGCSHVLTTPLKTYLPLLKLNEGEYVVIDERAGTDGVGTGITTGFDMAVVVAEPTMHGIKAAKQIATLLDFYKTPYVFALNKVSGPEDEELFVSTLQNFPDMQFAFDKSLSKQGQSLPEYITAQFDTLFERVHTLTNNRLERTKEKFVRNTEFKESKTK
jgi:CO dehydrogenase maturation factor